MDQISPQSWAGIHYSLLFSIAATQIVVIYLLNNSTLPPGALGIYTLYFVAAALCALAFLLQLSAFFLDNHSMLLLESCTIAFFCLLIIIFSNRSFTQSKNLGDAILGVAATATSGA